MELRPFRLPYHQVQEAFDVDPKLRLLCVHVSDGIVQGGWLDCDAVEQFRTQYEARKRDIFLVTYPKCGTTWMCKLCITLDKKQSQKNIKNHKLKLHKNMIYKQNICSEYFGKVAERIASKSDEFIFKH